MPAEQSGLSITALYAPILNQALEQWKTTQVSSIVIYSIC